MKGSEVRKKLKSIGISQAFIAEKMNISRQTLASMLRTSDIKVGVLDRIAKAVGKDIFFFLGDNENIYFNIPKVDSMKDDKIYTTFLETIESMRNYLLIFKK